MIKRDLQHQAYPFTELVHQILFDRDPSRTPLYQTTFAWENFNAFENRDIPMLTMDEACREWWTLGDLRLERIPINITLDHFDMDMKLVQVGEHFYCQIEYNTELFSRETVSRFNACFIEDGDFIHAIIKATAINNDGSDKIGFTAPSVNGQARAVLEAMTAAGVKAEDISNMSPCPIIDRIPLS